MIEVLRRVAWIGGLFAAAWTYYLTPPALLRIEPVDFAARYDQEYRQRRERTEIAPGVIEQGRATIAALTDPGSVEAYAARTLESRTIRIDGAAWERVLKQLSRSGPVFVEATGAPFAGLVPELVRRLRTSGWTNAYLALENGGATQYAEITYVDEPAAARDAPAGLVFPQRASSWPWALVAFAAYLLLPRRRPGPGRVTMDPVSAVFGLDAIGTLTAVVFFTIPLAIPGSTAAAFGEGIGTTIALWLFAAFGIGLVCWAARNASRTIGIDSDALQVTSFAGARAYRFSEIQSVQPLAACGIARAGVQLRMQDGRELRLPWRDFLRARLILDALAAHGHPLRAEAGEAELTHTPAGGRQPAPAGSMARRSTRWARPGLIVWLVCAVVAVLVWNFTREADEPPARDDNAEHQQSLLAAFNAAVASPASTTTLNLDGADFARLPAGIERLTALKTLTLNHARGLDLKSVLAQLAALPSIERLELAECGLKELPAEIAGLTQLKTLLVWSNELATLPAEIGRLSRLDWINIHQNHIRSLPAEMAALSALTSLDLGQNGLTEVPPAVCRLPSLTSLDLSRNVDLPSLPACLGNLERLEFLGLAFDMELRELPQELASLRRLKEVTGLEAGFLASPTLAALRKELPQTTFSGAAEGRLIDRMQEVTAEGDRIQREEDARKNQRRRIR
jgi:hypothetical protein